MHRLKKVFLWFTGIVAVMALLLFLAFKFSPWPSALIIRYAFTKDAVRVNKALAKHVPAGITAMLNQRYDENDKDALLDVYYPSAIQHIDSVLPVIVWIHGGGWISGNKEQLANYCKILASRGYVTVSLGYSIAPEKKYPVPVRQTAAALAYLNAQAKRFHINSGYFVLAGDSGGAHIAAQAANITCNSDYAGLMGIAPGISAGQLAGLLLYCGPYDAAAVNMSGSFAGFLRTVLWAYSGDRNFGDKPYFKTASVINYITSEFPPCFISAGNADPLLPQSQELAKKLRALNVQADTLFFRATHQPPLPHEYQFNLDTEEGRTALERSVAFMKQLRGTAP